jgi:hypothetical protein
VCLRFLNKSHKIRRVLPQLRRALNEQQIEATFLRLEFQNHLHDRINGRHFIAVVFEQHGIGPKQRPIMVKHQDSFPAI